MGAPCSATDDISLTLEHWCIWQAAESPAAAWPCGHRLAAADVGFLPLLQRRRLSPLARAAMATAWDCRGAYADLPAVFCSNHGESQAYFGMLEDLAAHRELSPSRFSLSVHNAIAGLYSQFSATRATLLVLAPGREGPFAALVEAAGLLLEGQERVLVACYDQPLPEAYQAYARGPEATVALAMRLSRGMGPRLWLRRQPGTQKEDVESCLLETLVHTILAGERHGRATAGPAVWEWGLDDG